MDDLPIPPSRTSLLIVESNADMYIPAASSSQSPWSSPFRTSASIEDGFTVRNNGR